MVTAMRYISVIILLAFCSLVYGQEKQKIAFIFVGEEPKKGTFKPFFSQMQMATMKKYIAEDRTEDFRKLFEQENEAQKIKAVSQGGIKYIISIEMPESIDGYSLTARMMDVETSEIVKMSIAESKLENSKDIQTTAQEIIAGLFDLSENSSSSTASNNNRATITDSRDKQIYEIVKIGNLTWMAKNMNYKTGVFWCYDNENSNCEKYGRLYDWNTAMKVCPSGWKLPSRSEWNELVQTIGKEVAGKKLKSRDGQGTDDFGFSALLGGRRNTGGSFDYLKEDGRWWTSTTTPEGTNAYYQYMNIKIDYIDEKLRPNDFANGYSVRCVMGSPDSNIAKPAVASSSKDSTKKDDNIFIDPRDKQEYKFIEIGRLVWMAKNMNYKIGTSWCYDDKDFNCKKYGRLYDWNAAKKACPTGWHLPNHLEWLDLIKFVDDEKIEKEKNSFFNDLGKDLFGVTGGIVGKMLDVVSEAIIGGVSGKKLKSKEYKGTDNYGFSALLGGGRNEKGFYYIDYGTAWWTATEVNSKEARDIFILKTDDSVNEGVFSKSDGYSVRCVKDY
ncbi:hypothetical protein R83H12_00598 [Fibrobacteria bacterium R8-3-H12]